MTKTSGNFTDFVSFSRASNGTALRRIAYGSELVTNGTFDTGDLTGWTYGSEWSYVDGKAVDSSSTFDDYLEQTITVTSGSLYLIQYSFSNIAGGTPALYISGAPAQVHSDDGDYSYMYRPSSSSFKVQFIGAAATFAVDNVSVKEVLFDDASGDLVLFNHPDDIPRVEYDASGNVKGLLIEEARTNLITYSEDFTDASWKEDGVVASSGVTIGPDGGSSAGTLIEDTNNSGHTAYVSGISGDSSTPHTFSVYLKKDSRRYAAVAVHTSGSNDYFGIWLDLETGLKTEDALRGTGALSSWAVSDEGSGWYRVSVTGTLSATTLSENLFPLVAMADVASGYNQLGTTKMHSYTGDGTSGIYIYGAQFEAGSFATSYIPTSGATATRSADICSIDVDQFGYNQKAGSVVVEAEMFNVAGTNWLASLGDAISDSIQFYTSSSAVRTFIRVGGVDQSAFNSATNVSSNTEFSFAAGFKPNDIVSITDGGAVATDTSALLPLITSDLKVGSATSGGNQLNGHIKSIKYYPRRLTNAQLQELTS